MANELPRDPHDRLYALAIHAAEDHKLTNIEKVGDSFVIRTPAGSVRVYSEGIASFDEAWLRWKGRDIRYLYRICLDIFLTSKLPPLPELPPSPPSPPKPLPWWRRLWCWVQGQKLPQARALLRPKPPLPPLALPS